MVVTDNLGNLGTQAIPIGGGNSIWSLNGLNAYYNDGNVGIGTTSATSKLQVNNTTISTPYSILLNSNNGLIRTNSWAQIHLQNKNASTTNFWHIGHRNNDRFDIAYGPESGTVIGTSNAKLVILPEGNVGIGTESPDNELDVNGDISLTDGRGRIEFKEGSAVRSFIDWNGNDLTIQNDDLTTNSDIFLTANGGSVDVDADVSINMDAQSNISVSAMNVLNLSSGFRTNITATEDIRLEATEDAVLDATARVFINADDDIYLRTGTGTPSTRLFINESGRVGVRTTTPTHTFSVFHPNGLPGLNGGNGLSIYNTSRFNTEHWALYARSEANQLSFLFKGEVCAQLDHDLGDLIAVSDQTLKTKIRPLEANQLEKIIQLKPVSYQMKRNKTKRDIIGLIAQEVQPLFPEIITEISNKEEGGENLIGIAYNRLPPILIAGMQEQQVIIDELRSTNDELRSTNEIQQTEIDDLKTRLTKIEALLQGNTVDQRLSTENLTLTDARLEQNHPNPFTESTLIRYFIPEGIKKAELQITNAAGKVLKEVPITNRGAGQTNIEAQSLNTGSYFYTLILNGKALATKQMILTNN